MRRIRLTLFESAIVIVMIGLICSLPSYYRRWVDRDWCRSLGEVYISRGTEFAAMADHPESWMDPFRRDFRRLAAWQLEKGRRLARSSVYDEAAEQRRIVEAGMDRYQVDFDRLYAKFKVAAPQHGYVRPSVPLRYYPGYIFGAAFAAWPFYGGVALLGTLLVVRRRRPTARACPRTDGGPEEAIHRLHRGGRLIVVGMCVLCYSLFWTLVSGGPPLDPDAGIWGKIGRMFRLTEGHAILTVLGLVAFAAGLHAFVVYPWRSEFRRGRAGPPEVVRADGLGPSP